MITQKILVLEVGISIRLLGHVLSTASITGLHFMDFDAIRSGNTTAPLKA